MYNILAMNEASDDNNCCAYLDIETTGLSPNGSDLTVIGVLVDRGGVDEQYQLYNESLNGPELQRILDGVKVIYTYNGKRFDLPFIHAKLNVDVSGMCRHEDLMFDCQRRNLYGGLKKVERMLDIGREVEGVDGLEAVRLWYRYVESADEEALSTLLEYNMEDVVNLKILRRKLGV